MRTSLYRIDVHTLVSLMWTLNFGLTSGPSNGGQLQYYAILVLYYQKLYYPTNMVPSLLKEPGC